MVLSLLQCVEMSCLIWSGGGALITGGKNSEALRQDRK